MLLAAACLLATTASPVLEGVVVDPKGVAVAGAVVRTTPAVPKAGELPLKATTGKDGRFRIELKRATPLVVRVLARTFAPVVLEKVDATKPLRVVLGPGAIIEGVVRDAATRQPLPGVVVVAREEGASVRLATPWEAEDAAATTDGTGQYRLDSLRAVRHTIVASARGYRRVARSEVLAQPTPTARLETFLVPGPVVTGLVRDAAGRPVAGAVVRFHAVGRPWEEVPAASSRADGTWDAAPGSGRHVVVVLHRDYAPAIVPEIVVDAAGEHVDVRLGAPAVLRARLVDEDGRPLEGQLALLSVEGAHLPSRLRGAFQATSAADGRVELPGLPDGALVLLGSARGVGPKTVDVSVPAPQGRQGAVVDLGEVTLEAGRRLRGRVLDPAGRGIAEASIWAHDGRGAATSSESNADGTFVLGGLPEGRLRVEAWRDGWAGERRDVAADTQTVDFTLRPEGVISGRVVDASGEAVPSFEVTPSLPDDEESSGWTQQGEGGELRVKGLKPGTWGLRVEAPDLAPATVSNIQVTVGSVADIGVIRMQRGGRLRGVVVDTAGAGVAGAEVEVHASGRQMFNRRDVVTTDGAGAFEIGGVLPGRYDLRITHPAYAPSTQSNVVVGESGSSPDVRVTLRPGGRVVGVVRSRTPVAGYVTASSRGEANPFLAPQGSVRPDGTFTIERVPAGPADVTLMLEHAPGRASSARTVAVDVPEGGEATAEIVLRDIRVYGRLTSPDGPVGSTKVVFTRANARMSMSYYGAPPGGTIPLRRNEAVTSEDGSYEVRIDEAAEDYLVRVENRERGLTQSIPNVRVPDVEEHALDLTLPGVVVAGVVTDGVTGEPVEGASVDLRREPPDASRGAAIETRADGSFRGYVAEGTYRLSVFKEKYATLNQSLEIDGPVDLRLQLSAGAELRGVVVDAGGRAVNESMVSGRPASGERTGSGRMAGSDGAFVLPGLSPGLYNVVAGSAAAGWGVARNVSVPGSPVRIATGPVGFVELTVRCRGAAADRAHATVDDIDATPVGGPWIGFAATGGRIEAAAPAGRLRLRVTTQACGERLVDVEVAAGKRVSKLIDFDAKP